MSYIVTKLCIHHHKEFYYILITLKSSHTSLSLVTPEQLPLCMDLAILSFS